MKKPWLTLFFVFGSLIFLDSEVRLLAQTSSDKPSFEAPSKPPGATVPTPSNPGTGTNASVGVNSGIGANPGTGNPADGINPGTGMNADTKPVAPETPDAGKKTGTDTEGK